MSRGNGEGTIYYHADKKRWVGQYLANKKEKQFMVKLEKKLVKN